MKSLQIVTKVARLTKQLYNRISISTYAFEEICLTEHILWAIETLYNELIIKLFAALFPNQPYAWIKIIENIEHRK